MNIVIKKIQETAINLGFLFHESDAHDMYLEVQSVINSSLTQRAFNAMVNGEALKLSKEGKEELNSVWKDSVNRVWHIQSISNAETVCISSEDHFVFEHAPLEWFEL